MSPLRTAHVCELLLVSQACPAVFCLAFIGVPLEPEEMQSSRVIRREVKAWIKSGCRVTGNEGRIHIQMQSEFVTGWGCAEQKFGKKKRGDKYGCASIFFFIIIIFSTRNGEKGTEDYREIFYKEVELERTPCLVVILWVVLATSLQSKAGFSLKRMYSWISQNQMLSHLLHFFFFNLFPVNKALGYFVKTTFYFTLLTLIWTEPQQLSSFSLWRTYSFSTVYTEGNVKLIFESP